MGLSLHAPSDNLSLIFVVFLSPVSREMIYSNSSMLEVCLNTHSACLMQQIQRPSKDVNNPFL